MNKKQILKHLETEVYSRLQQSKYGIGVFAIRDIKKGAEPFKGMKYEYTIAFTKDELTGLHPEVKKMIHDYSAFTENQYNISSTGFNNLSMEFFINHSEKPTIEYNARGKLVARCDISAGEELTTNYDDFNEQNTLHFKDF